MSEPSPPAQPGPAVTGLSYGLVLVLAVLLAVWGAFLVPLRLGSVPLPVSWLVALVGNGVLGWAGGRVLGRAGAAGPGLVWLAVALVLSSARTEGDLVVPGTIAGMGFLLIGAMTSAVAFGAAPRRTGTRCADAGTAAAADPRDPPASPQARLRRPLRYGHPD